MTRVLYISKDHVFLQINLLSFVFALFSSGLMINIIVFVYRAWHRTWVVIQGESLKPSLHQALTLGILLADHLLLTTYLLYEGTHISKHHVIPNKRSLHLFCIIWVSGGWLVNVQDGFWIPRIGWVIIPLFYWDLICYVSWCRMPNDFFLQIEEVGLITEKMKSTGDTVIKMRMKR